MGRPINAHQANGCDRLVAIQELETVVPTVTEPLFKPWAKVLSHDLQLFRVATCLKKHLLAM